MIGWEGGRLDDAEGGGSYGEGVGSVIGVGAGDDEGDGGEEGSASAFYGG